MPQPARAPARFVWIIVLAVVAVYWPACGFEFVSWDDVENVAANPDMNPVTGESVARYWRGPYRNMYIPVAYSAWAGIAAVARTPAGDGVNWSLNPWLFHGANLLVHLASSLLVFAILRRLLGRSGMTASDWPACAGAVLFAIHPVQVEPVAWVTGMRDLLSGLFALIAVWCYLGSAMRGEVRVGRVAYVAGVVAFALAVLAKPAAMTLPLALAAIDLLVIGRSWRAVGRSAGGWLVISLAAGVVTRWAQPSAEVESAPLWARPLVAADAASFYLGQIVLPLRLCIDYGRSPQWLLGSAAVYWTFLPAVAVVVGLWAGRRRWRWATCAGVIVLAFLLPVLGLVRFDFQRHSTVADRYLYLAMLGPALLLAWVCARDRGRGLAAVVAGLLAVYAIRAHVQVWTWRDSETLFAHAISVNPTTLAGNNGLAQMRTVSNDPGGAVPLLEAALRAHPEDAITNYNLGNALLLGGRPGEAIGRYRVALRRRHDPFLHTNLATALARMGRVEEAIAVTEEGLGHFPGNPELRSTLEVLLAARKGPSTSAASQPSGR